MFIIKRKTQEIKERRYVKYNKSSENKEKALTKSIKLILLRLNLLRVETITIKSHQGET